MRSAPWRRTRIARAAIIGAVIAAAGVTAAAWPGSHHPAALARPTCGSASTHALTGHTQLLLADPGALACFARAARECRPASLAVTEMGVDTGTSYVFLIEPGPASCRVTEQRQDYSANFGGSQSAVTTVPCRRIAETAVGVALRCAGQDVLIPAKVSNPVPGAPG